MTEPTFAPIAVVGRACVLPGAHSPEALWDAVLAGRSLLSSVPEGRWRGSSADLLCAPGAASTDRSWSDQGGYVTGFEELWDPRGFGVHEDELAGLDSLALHVLHTARKALADAGDVRTGAIDRPRVSAVFGNLGYPSASLTRYAESVWTGAAQRPDPRNRFMSGGTAELLADALGLGPHVFCLDTACASSLYAIKLACDQLHDGRADVALAGAVSGADDLFIHVGFCALEAMSKSGQSRPFHAQADGLVPAEGAGFVVLKRLADAQRDGDTIHGVIRGVGLSNDGKGRGFLAPAAEGQVRAMRAAYAMAGVSTDDVSLLECHATGTTVGDATEIASGAELFAGRTDLPLGSLKSNLGHLITAAGVAGLIKVLEAMRHGVRPPNVAVDAQNPALAGSPFRLLQAPEPWEGRKLAGVSAFGFGGNNAHLLVQGPLDLAPEPTLSAGPPAHVRFAVVGAGAIVGSASSAGELADIIVSGGSLLVEGEARTESVALDLVGLRFPPKDLADSLAQQLTVLAAAREATSGLTLPRDTSGVFLGMEPDVEVARYGARWRLPEQIRATGQSPDEQADWLAETRDSLVPKLSSAGVVGRMPNIPTNRISSALDLGGPGVTVSQGEGSGSCALSLAMRALATGELDAALVCAVDLSCNDVHREALAAAEGASSEPGDAAVALTLKRADDAERDGDVVLAWIETTEQGQPLHLDDRLGRSWAAGELRDLVAAVLAVQQGVDPDGRRLAPDQSVDIALRATTVRIQRATPHVQGPALILFAADTPQALLSALRDGAAGGQGPARAVLLAATPEQLATRRQRAIDVIERGVPAGPGVHVRLAPVHGETAFVFAGAGAAYAGQGRGLLGAFPELTSVLDEHPELQAAFDAPWGAEHAPELQRLWSSSALCGLHDRLSRQILGLTPQAVIGYSSGESNSLFTSGVWSDPDAMIREANAGGLFTERIGGRMDVLRDAWGTESWETWTVLAPLADVQALVADEPRAYVSVIHTDTDCIVAGDPAACARVCESIGRSRCLRLHYDLVVHVPELSAVSEEWLDLHRREVTTQPVRVYSAGHGGSYAPSREACAQAILAQADRTLDFRAVIEAAYRDGVRVFVEHGPQGSCTRWIRDILGDREAVVVSLDRKGGAIDAVLDACAALLAASVPVDVTLLSQRVRPAPPSAKTRLMRFPAHPPPVHLPPVPEVAMQSMPPAPSLPLLGLHDPAVPALAPPPEVAAPVAATPSPRTVLPAGTDPAAEALARSLAALGASHQQFMAHQAAAHEQFMAAQARAMQVLTTGAGQMAQAVAHVHALSGVAVVAPSAPVVAPPPRPVAPPPPVTAPPPRRITEEKIIQPPPAAVPTLGTPIGPTFSRQDLEVHAGGVISTIFGDMFTVQDGYARQVRMPEPPLLLADRVTGIDAEPGSMKTGTIWTETDVTPDSWYLHQGHMPTGVLIEAGQADLMLISWLGVDFTNRGDRVYRLLGCDLTLHGPLPCPGETLQYRIVLDGHAAQGDIRLMFFHYDGFVNGERRVSVRQGQAGFFTDGELADSDGCLWTPQGQDIVANPRLAAPVVTPTKTSYTPSEVRAFSDGRPWECFGPGFERTQTHTRTPRIANGRMLFLDGGVQELLPTGGPWGRGYLSATVDITPEHWFFDGHFKNDPCMPGTLMFDGCLQAMSFFLAGLGFTTDSDGYRFEPVQDEPFPLHCRGQVTPASKRLTYEVFVEELVGGPSPVLYADLLCTVDGLKAFHARRIGLRLVPGWPLDEGSALLDVNTTSGRSAILPPPAIPPVVADADGFKFDQRSLIACANGRPSQAFGPMYTPFDGTTRVARLPNPPYLFISRATDTRGPIGSMQEGLGVTMEYDIPADSWYFDENGCRVMPYAVLLEAALQPCGWLASYTGCALTSDKELFFRNLDGTSTLHRDILPTDVTWRTVVTNTGISKMGPMIIVNYEVECFVGDELVYDMTTVFGFFPAEALADQKGLTTTPAQRALLEGDSAFHVDLTTRPAAYWDPSRPNLAEPMLLMLDRITAFEADGGSEGLGFARGEKDVRASEWFFKAHFFQDPVQPGSLGIEAMIQLLQWFMLHEGMDEGVTNPRFESIGTKQPMTWKYRGQVIPTNKVIGSTMEVTERGTDERGPYAICSASLWVDGKRIYEASGLGMRIVSGGTDPQAPHRLDPARDTWLNDHCPTYTRPALPMMSMVDLLASSGPISDPVIGLADVKVLGWLDVSQPTELRVDRRGELATLLRGDEPMASARVLSGSYPPRPEPLPPLDGPVLDPYATGSLFHGPAFQVVQRLVRTKEGASSILRAESGVPFGTLNQALLDGATHGIPHDQLDLWDDRLPADKVAYPALIPSITFYGPPPTSGTVRCEVRPDGYFGTKDFPAFQVQLIDDGGVWCAFRLIEACFPKGKLGSAEPADRRAFLRDHTYVPGLSLSTQDAEATVLDPADVAGADWLAGTVAGVYGTEEVAEIAEREHLARAHGIHPGLLPAALPYTQVSLETETASDGSVRVSGDATGTLDIASVKEFWSSRFGVGRWPVEDLYYGLIQRFVGRVVVTNPAALDAVRGRPAIFLANHQTGVESLIFSILASGLTEVPTVTLAKIEHQHTWLGKLIEHCFRYPNVRDPKLITFFDRDDKASLPAVMGELAAEMAKGDRSVMVHVEGTRSLECRTPVRKMSGGFIDMALGVGAPVIPVRFVGGLPSEPMETRLEFPLGMGTQDIWIGEPLLPEQLTALHYGARKQLVLDAINGLGPGCAVEQAHPGDSDFAASVADWQAKTGIDEEHAVLRAILAECEEPTEASQQLLAASSASELPTETPEQAWLAELATRLLG